MSQTQNESLYVCKRSSVGKRYRESSNIGGIESLRIIQSYVRRYVAALLKCTRGIVYRVDSRVAWTTLSRNIKHVVPSFLSVSLISLYRQLGISFISLGHTRESAAYLQHLCIEVGAWNNVEEKR